MPDEVLPCPCLCLRSSRAESGLGEGLVPPGVRLPKPELGVPELVAGLLVGRAGALGGLVRGSCWVD